MRYDYLIRRPFEIVARRPYLWLLGFLAGAATAFNFSSGGTNYGHPATAGTYHGPSWAVLQNIWHDNSEWIVGILALFVVVFMVMFVLGCIATGGIIHAAVEHDADNEYALGKAWRAGYATGWRIAGLRLLTFLLAIVPGFLVGSLVLAAVAGAMSSAVAAFGFGLMAAVAFLVSIAFWFALGLAFQFAQRLVVLEDGNVAQSLSTGFRMIRWHFKVDRGRHRCCDPRHCGRNPGRGARPRRLGGRRRDRCDRGGLFRCGLFRWHPGGCDRHRFGLLVGVLDLAVPQRPLTAGARSAGRDNPDSLTLRSKPTSAHWAKIAGDGWQRRRHGLSLLGLVWSVAEP